jgi:hypothetical protein
MRLSGLPVRRCRSWVRINQLACPRHVCFPPVSDRLADIVALRLRADCVAKVLIPLLIKNSLGCRCVFRINIWGTSSHSDELTGDFGNEPEAISIGDHGLSRLLAEKSSPHDLGLLQHNLPCVDGSELTRTLLHVAGLVGAAMCSAY